MKGFESRLAAIEQRLQRTLPGEYADFLASHVATANSPEWVVSTNPDYFGVRSIFELGDGPDYAQADRTYEIVGDVLPPGWFPIADDEGGNFYLIYCGQGSTRGNIAWWDHERDPDDMRMLAVAETLKAFLSVLAPSAD